MSYDSELEIDGHSLDKEWQVQAKLFSKYAAELAIAEKRAKQADELVKTLRSELIMEINKHPEKFDVPESVKLTDAKVEAIYRQHADYKKAKQDRINAEYERDMAKVAADAFNYHRKAALEHMVTLHGQQYFAGPAVPHDIGREFVKKVETARREDARDNTVRQVKPEPTPIPSAGGRTRRM